MSQTKTVLETIQIPVDQIKPSPYQPRLIFNLEDIKGSIMRDGILVALTVRKKDGYYELIDGERRWRVAKELGYKAVPCNVIDIDDETARRMIWRVNTLRKDYSTEEKARYMKKLQKDGLSLREIGRITGYSHQVVNDHLNVFQLPEFYQKMVWSGKIGIGHIHELAPLFNKGGPYGPRITKWLDEILERRLTGFELRKAISPELEEIEEQRVEAAKKAVPKIVPEVKVPETPKELEEAARALRKRAEELRTPEQVLEENREKARRVLSNILSKVKKAKDLGLATTEFEKRIEGFKAKIVGAPNEVFKEANELKKSIDTIIKEYEEKQREAKIRERLEKEFEEKKKEEVKEELLKDEEFRKELRTEVMKGMMRRPEVTPPLIEMTEEEAKVFQERIEQQRQKMMEWMLDPDIQKRGKLFKNWVAHGAILDVIGSVFCPDHPEKSASEDLKWSCGLSVKEAYEILRKKLSRKA